MDGDHPCLTVSCATSDGECDDDCHSVGRGDHHLRSAYSDSRSQRNGNRLDHLGNCDTDLDTDTDLDEYTRICDNGRRCFLDLRRARVHRNQ